LPAQLAEIKRLASLAAGIAPARKSTQPNLTEKRGGNGSRVDGTFDLANKVVEWVSQPPEITGFTALDQDVLVALLTRPQAEAAVRRAKAKIGDRDFEPLFRQALEFVR
jgi:hypothetical protein